jgi:DNA polymerase III delta subunit
MIIFIGGPHGVAASKKLEEALAAFKKEPQKKFHSLEFDAKNNFAEFKSVFETVSMFASAKVVVLKNLFAKESAKFREDFFVWAENKNIQNSKDDILMIFEKGSLGKEDLSKLNKICKEKNYFEMPEGSDLKKWIKTELEAAKIPASPDLVEGLFHVADPLSIKNEIEKLACFMAGKQHVPDTKAKHQIEFSSKGDDREVFSMIEDILSGQKNKAIKTIHKQIRSGKAEQMILGAMHYQIKNLLKIKKMLDMGLSPAEISQKTKLPGFVVDKNARLLSKIDFQKLKNAQELIFKCDLKIKSGRIDPKLALEMLASEI